MSESALATEKTFCPASSRRFVLFAAILASSMAFIDGSVVSIATPAIRDELPATLSEALWISNAYMLFLASLILIGGAAGDSFGLRRVFSGGILLFVAASAVCAVAPNATVLVIARAIQGVGAAFMVPGSLAIIAKAYPADERGAAIGKWAAASALTTALGPVSGGFLLSLGGDGAWRIIFAINLPLGGITLFLLLTKVPADSVEGRRKLDWLGGVLIALCLFVFAWSFTRGAGEGSMPNANSMGLGLVLAFALLVGFLWLQMRTASPMVPLSLFRNHAFSGANALTFSHYFGLSAMLFFLPMTVIGGWDIDEAQSALLFIPLSVSIALLSGFAGKLADKYGPALLITIGSVLIALAYGFVAITAHRMDFWFNMMPAMVLASLGMAMIVSPLSTAVMTSVSDDDTGTASGVNNAISRVASLFALAAMGLVAQFAYQRSAVSGNGTTFGQILETSDASILAAHGQATTEAFIYIAWITCVLSLISALIAWLTLQRK